MENKLKTVDAETLLSTPMNKTMFLVDNLVWELVERKNREDIQTAELPKFLI